MGAKVKAFLCIGGPYDGKRFATERDYFQVYKAPKLPVISFSQPVAPPDTVSIDTVTYTIDFLRDAGDEVWFCRPVQQSRVDTLKLLLARYEKTSNTNWEENPFT